MFYERRKNDLFIAERRGSGKLRCGAHMHYHLELVYMRSGSSSVFVDDYKHDIPADSLFLCFPNQLHAYEESTRYEDYLIIIVNPSTMPELSQYFDTMMPEDPVFRNVSAHPALRAILDLIIQEEQGERDSLSLTKYQGLVAALFSELFRHMPMRDVIKGESGALKKILTYCSRNFHEEISLTHLAEELHMSKYYISHLFSTHLNMRFNDYVNSLRVSAASRYLYNTDKSVTEISDLVGFGTVRTFNRAFMKQYGKTPSEYRSQNVFSQPTAIPEPPTVTVNLAKEPEGYIDPCCVEPNDFDG